MSGTDYDTTPNLHLYKPRYDMDDEQWGAHLNLNADMLDAYLSPGGNPAFVPITGGTMTGSGRLALSGDPIGPLDAVTKQYFDSHTGTGSQIYLGGWDPVANNPTLASGALANGVLTPKGSYYLATVGGTSPAIDGLTIWLAGDYITSNGTIWQRIQASSSPYLPLTGGSVSGSLTVGGTFTHGSNTATQRFLNINAAANANKNIQFQSAGLNRWILRSDQSSGDDLVIQGCNDAGAAIGTLLQFDRVYGAQRFTPYPTVISGADGGTPGLSMSYSMTSSYSGATSFSGGIVFNRWWVTGDTVTDNDQGVYYLFQGDYGPATTGGGRTGMQITLRSVGGITSGNAVVLNGFRSLVQGLHSGGMTPAWNGGNVQAMDLMSQIVDGATGWGATNIIQANNNISGVGQNNFIRRTGLYVACGLDAGTQGGRLDAVICTSVNPVNNPTGGYPAPGQGYRYYLGIGNGGSSSFTVDAYNGEIIGTIPAISTPNNQLVAMPTQSCLHGTNFSKINFVENAFWSPGFKVRGDGTTRIARMQVSAGANGPVIDAPLQAATIIAVTASTSGFGAGLGAYVGEQCYDHLGGIAVVDTVSGTGAVLTAHYLYPPNVVAGEVITVASGIVAALASSGATVVHLRAGTYGGAAGDTVTTAKAVAGVPGGTTVVSFVESQTDCVVTLSAALTANVPVGTMMLFTQTMPATVTFRTGSEATWSASVTWAAATTISIGSSAVRTTVNGTLQSTSLLTATSSGAVALQVGTNTTGNTLQLNGSTASPSPLEFAQANIKRQHLQLDSAGNFTGFAYDGAGANATRWMTAAGTTGALTFYTPATFNGNPFQVSLPTTNWANNAAALVSGSVISLTGNYNNNPYMYVWNIPADTATSTGQRLAIGHTSIAHQYGGTGHGGGRAGLTVSLQQAGITDASGPTPGAGSYSAGRFWVDHSFPSGGTDLPNNPGGFVYGGNYKNYLHQGALYYGVYNGTFEADFGVEGSTRRITIAGTVTAGDTLTLTFTSASIVGSPLAVSITAIAGDTVNSLAAKLYAKVTLVDALNTAQVGASYGAVGAAGSAVYASPTLASFMLVYAPWIGLTVTQAVGGAATETITIGTETVGASTNNKLGMTLLLANNDGLRGYLQGSALFGIGGGFSNGTASGWEYLMGINTSGGRGGSWPFVPTATLFGAALQVNQLAQTNSAPSPVSPPRLFSAMDFRNVNYTKSAGFPLAFPNFRVDGTGVLRLGNATLTPSSAGLAISAAGWTGTTITVSAGGGTAPYNYFPGDICFDAYDGQYEVTAVNSAGAVTAFNVLVMPTAPAGAAPAAVQVTQGGSGVNFAVNITWVSASAVVISAGSGAAAPTTTQIPAGMSGVWKNTTDASVKLYYNDAGTMRSAVLT